MILLALDTSHKTGSLCLAKETHVLSSTKWENEKSHAELLTAQIEKTLRANRLEVKDVDYFCVNYGPGSFTGIRIAVNAIKSFAYAYGKPVIAMNSLEIIAHSCEAGDKRLGVAVNAHSCLCYYAEFEKQKLISDILVIPMEQVIKKLSLPNIVFAGDAFEFYSYMISKDIKIPRPPIYSDIPLAEKLYELSLLKINSKNLSDIKTWETLEPFYLRASAPEEKLDQRTKLDQSVIKK